MNRSLLVVLLSISLSGSGFAEKAKTETTPAVKSSPWSVQVALGYTLGSYPIGVYNVDNRMSAVGTVMGNYFFNETIGVFGGISSVSRGFQSRVSTKQTSAGYWDALLGLTLNTSGSLSGGTRPLIHLGGYYAFPGASTYTGDFDMSAVGTTTQGYFGLYVDHQMTFLLTGPFAIGYNVWAKIPLGDALTGMGNGYQAKFIEGGLGLVIELR